MRKLKKYEMEVKMMPFGFLTEGDLWRAIPDSPLRKSGGPEGPILFSIP